MTNSDQPAKKSRFKSEVIQWSVIVAVALVLYMTGLHKDVIATLQRAMMWTGLYDVTAQIDEQNGPFLDATDYNFAMTDQNGMQVNLDTFEGEVLFINLWASWCPPCIAEMPTIQALHDDVADQGNIKFIMLSMDQDREEGRKFMKDRGFEMPYYFPVSSVPAELSSSYLPTTFIISAEGQIVYKHEGFGNFDTPEFRDFLISLADETQNFDE